MVLIAAAQWRVFFQRRGHCTLLAFVSWLAFGSESWQAFFHWLPMFTQAFLTDGDGAVVEDAQPVRADPLFRRERTIGMGVPLIFTASDRDRTGADVARQCARYTLRRPRLQAGTLLTTPYLFMYDMVVLHPDRLPGPYRARGQASARTSFRRLPARLRCDHHLHLTGLPLGLAATLRSWPARSSAAPVHGAARACVVVAGGVRA